MEPRQQTPNKEYWQRRTEQRLEESLKKAETTEKYLRKQYNKALLDIRRDIEVLYARFARDTGLDYNDAIALIKGNEYKEWRMTMESYIAAIKDAHSTKESVALTKELETLAARSRVTRLQALEAQITVHVKALGLKENEAMGELLEQTYETGYYKHIYELQKEFGIGFPFAKLSADEVANAMLTPWSGDNFSNRVWDNKDALLKNVRQLVTQHAIQGSDIKTLSRELASKMETSYSSAVRLVRTETAYVHGQADLKAYEEEGVEEYEYLATLDSKTSTACQELDGKTFKLEDAKAGVNYPPLHPHCRSTTAESFPKNYGSRIARDSEGKSYYVPRDISYKEWQEKYAK